MTLYPAIVSTLGGLALVAVAAAGMFAVGLATPAGRRRLQEGMAGSQSALSGFAFVVAVVAMSGSLYLSEVANFTPCLLCWYQRIAMYPLVPILAVATWLRDPGAWRYALPLSLIGLAISIYHVAIQFRPALDSGTCGVGPPCSARYVAVFGFVSVPTMAGAAFLLISAVLLVGAVVGASERTPGP